MTGRLDSAPRESALDALRGLSVLAMVLSGSIAFGGVMPGWMYHAQVPPPLHRFDPSRVGITWVDLVFPFFLFAMGAALPWAMAARLHWRQWLPVALRRFALLLFLALFYQHMKATNLVPGGAALWAQGLALVAFLLLGLIFAATTRPVRLAALAAGCGLLALLPFADGQGFRAGRSDIILVVLANMALAGALLYALTQRRPLLSLAALPFVAAVLLGATAPGSWNQWLLQATPAPWATKFLFLKYLFIVVPGLFAGRWLLQATRAGSALAPPSFGVAALAAALIVCNVVLLYERALLWNLGATLALLGALALAARTRERFTRRAVAAAAYLLLLGLALEALEGGIRKDSSTFSYYFVTSGLAFLALLLLRDAARWRASRAAVEWLAAQGRNPLLGYVAGALVVLPLLHLSGLHAAWAGLDASPGQGLLKGLLFTAAVAGIVMLANRWRWVWRA